MGRKFTKFEHNVDRLSSLHHLIADLWWVNTLWNAKSKSKGRSTRRQLYNFLCLKLWGHWTEPHQISIRCTEMIADYYAEIKIAIFQSVWKRQRDDWRSSSNCGQIEAKITCFNSVTSEIIGRNFTKFGNDAARLLSLNHLKADIRSANALSNAEAKSKDRSTRRFRTSPKFNWLP